MQLQNYAKLGTLKNVERTLTDFPLPACSRAKTSQECCLTERELHWLHRSVVLYVSRWPRARRRQKKWHDMPIGPIVSSRWLQWCWSTEAWSNFVKDQRTVKLYCCFFPSPSLKGPESGNSPGSFASYPFKTVLQMDRGKCLVLEHAHAIICAWSSIAQRLQISAMLMESSWSYCACSPVRSRHGNDLKSQEKDEMSVETACKILHLRMQNHEQSKKISIVWLCMLSCE